MLTPGFTSPHSEYIVNQNRLDEKAQILSKKQAPEQTTHSGAVIPAFVLPSLIQLLAGQDRFLGHGYPPVEYVVDGIQQLLVLNSVKLMDGDPAGCNGNQGADQ